ncbi:MAG: reverse transcriptase-like protein [Ignavibacteriae bacterium]|nr:reverse transcriptase-like protein [Ignavibacteriota bacterium]
MHLKYPYEKQIKEKSSEFINKLSENNILADIISDSLREYSVKIKVNDYGIVNLYYKPTQDTYTITLHEIKDKENSLILQNFWNELNGISAEGDIYKNKGYEIDVDGSYQKGITSYGVVIRKDGKVVKEISGIVEVFQVKGSHQVAGEIKAVTESIEWCRKNNINETTIYYDYKGLEKWARGLWKTKKEISKEYADFMKTDNIKIHWVKIKSHTGKKWNEYADKLAANAIGKHLREQ